MSVLQRTLRLATSTTWRWALPLALLTLGGGCQTIYMDQVAVPNSNQRLVVGHDGGPFRRIWVIEDGKAYDVKVVSETRR